MGRLRRRTWLSAAVFSHLAVSVLHGTAHTGARVPLSPAANLFVFVVILAGPVAGWAVSWVAEQAGNWVVAGTMAASLVFGLVNHFVLSSLDHVGHVDPQWRTLFAGTAVLLALLEAAGAALALSAIRRRSVS
jgi:hypothetical protein